MKLGGGPLRHIITLYINQLVRKLADFFVLRMYPVYFTACELLTFFKSATFTGIFAEWKKQS